MVGDERVGMGRVEQGRGRGEGMRAERMVGNARVGRVGEGWKCEGR